MSNSMTSSPTTPTCYELRIAIDDGRKDALVELLHALGENEFVEGAVDCDTEVDYDPAGVPSDQYDDFARGSPVIFYDEDRERLETLRANVLARAGDAGLNLGEAAFHLAPLADQNWRESWKASFRPIDVKGVFVILPPWEDPQAFAQPHKIIIDPGMAFGTGQHETTRLCLEMLLELPSIPARVLDVGTGSGILAIAARMRGSALAWGNDVDPQSVLVAKENSRVNGVDDGHTLFTEETAGAIARPDGGFDLVFANIQIKPLMRITPEILGCARVGAPVLFSGILAEEVDEFLAYLALMPVRVIATRRLGHWMGIHCEALGPS
jgi:ribosomal protein L11 methyltransferase